MRRMVKDLLKFDATPLFPERISTVPYKLSDGEAKLYKAVTITSGGSTGRSAQNDKRAGTVGFALTILQRRLASSLSNHYPCVAAKSAESFANELPNGWVYSDCTGD